jgi:hypothetical protein
MAFMLRGRSVPLQRDLYESESSLTGQDNQGICPCWMEDVGRLDETIGRFLPIALSAEQTDFEVHEISQGRYEGLKHFHFEK